MIPLQVRNWSIVAIVLCAAGAFAALLFYRGRLAENAAWDSKVRIEEETRLHASIFKIAEARGLIGIKKGPSGELFLEPPACEDIMLKKLRSRASGSAGPQTSENDIRTALNLLCSSPQGEEIRNEIEAWNAAYDLLGVRDNRSQNSSCPSKKEGLSAEIFVPRGCKPNDWKVERIFRDGTAAASWISGAEPSPNEFSFIANSQPEYAYYGDWAVLRSGEPELGDTGRPRYRMYSEEIVLRPNGRIYIDVVGRVRGVKVYAASLSTEQADRLPRHIVDPSKPETPTGGIMLGPVRGEISIQCGSESQFEEAQRRTQEALNSADDDDGDDDETDDKTACEDSEPPATSRIPIAYVISLRPAGGFRSGDVSVRVELDAEPVQVLPPPLSKNWGAATKDKAQDQKAQERKGPVLRLTRHIEANCPSNFREEGTCELSWERIPGAQRPKPPQFQVALEAEPGRNLVDETTGIIKSEAFEDGLAPIIGLGPQDWGSLAFAMATRGRNADGSNPAPVRLTIDPRIQKIARDAIGSSVRGDNCQPAPKSKKKNARGAKPGPCLLLRDDQTATLVVLNADSKAGEIKAVASWPTPVKHLHVWDLQALESEGAGMSAAAWRLVVPDQRPGSTFKVITAMTAIDLATRPPVQTELRTRLQDILSGKMPLRDHVQFLRLVSAAWEGKKCKIASQSPVDVNAIPVPSAERPRWCARNYRARGEGATAYWQTRPTSPDRHGCPGGSQFGMCEALMVSSNLFFGGLAEQMTQRGPREGSTRLGLDMMARRLSFDDQVCLDSKGQAKTDKEGKPRLCGFDLLRRMPDMDAAKLRADPINFDIKSHAGASDIQRLLRSGWGDGESATALAMATVYASLGRNRLVRPSIVPLERKSDGCPSIPLQDECQTLLPDSNRATNLIGVLRKGLYSVGGAGGSAGRVFGPTAFASLRRKPNGEPRLFVKTGTASYRAWNQKTDKPSNYFSLWLAGWIEGAPGTPVPERLAFACVITRGNNNETGGGTCARLVQGFLAALNQAGAVR